MRILIGVIFSILISFRPFIVFSDERLLVDMILVSGARKVGAVCLDGSLPGYHLHRGSGAGARNWLLQFEGGGWCNDIRSCLERSNTNHGSTRYMRQYEVFSGILSNNASFNPDFYNWNRVKLRYCDGASFSGDSEFLSDTTVLYFRGKRIWDAIILDLLPRGLNSSEKVLLSGCSAGGLATFLHCDNLTRILPSTTTVKCLSDAGFFLDIKDVLGNRTIRTFFDDLVSLQGVRKNLDKSCTATDYFEAQCFFPQHALPFIKTPYFLLNSAYDVFQFHHIIVPPSADPYGRWQQCKLDSDKCNPFEMNILQGFRTNMLEAMSISLSSRKGGMYINSCFAHCQSEFQDTWFASNSPRIHNKTIAEAVGDWYFERNTITKEIDCPIGVDFFGSKAWIKNIQILLGDNNISTRESGRHIPKEILKQAVSFSLRLRATLSKR